MSTAPPILCKHPMLDTLEALAGNHEALSDLIRGIRQTGNSASARLASAEEAGLLGRYSEPQKLTAHARLLGSWGNDETLLRISNRLGDALELVLAQNKPLRARWLAGATEQGVECAVHESKTSDFVYFLLLTPPLTGDMVAGKAAFDTSFLGELKTLATALKAFADGF
jgi:hypothetical protein